MIPEKEIKANDGNSGNACFMANGKFYIHGQIDESYSRNIIQPLVDEIERRSKMAEKQPLEFFISSNGGDLYACYDTLSLFELARARGIAIHTYVLSYAASAASLIAVSGDYRFASQRAAHMLHFARSWDFSHNPEMALRNHNHIIFLQNELLRIYQERTKLKDLPEKLIADNLTINGGKNLLKNGLIDEII